MLARKKNCPLMSKWTPIKGKHKALSNRGIFKGDVESPINSYDDAVQAYADALEDKKKLVDLLKTMSTNLDKIGSDQDKLKAERDKSEEDAEFGRDQGKVDSYTNQPDADSAEVLKALNSLATTIEKSFNLHKRVMDQIVSVGSGRINVIKQARDEYKTKSDKVESVLQKAYDDSGKAQERIRAVVSDFMETADEIENNDLKNQLQGFYKLANG